MNTAFCVLINAFQNRTDIYLRLTVARGCFGIDSDEPVPFDGVEPSSSPIDTGRAYPGSNVELGRREGLPGHPRGMLDRRRGLPVPWLRTSPILIGAASIIMLFSALDRELRSLIEPTAAPVFSSKSSPLRFQKAAAPPPPAARAAICAVVRS